MSKQQQPKECQHVKHLCTYPEECAEETTSGECSRPHPAPATRAELIAQTNAESLRKMIDEQRAEAARQAREDDAKKIDAILKLDDPDAVYQKLDELRKSLRHHSEQQEQPR